MRFNDGTFQVVKGGFMRIPGSRGRLMRPQEIERDCMAYQGRFKGSKGIIGGL